MDESLIEKQNGNFANTVLVGAVGLCDGSVCFCSFLRMGGKNNHFDLQKVTK